MKMYQVTDHSTGEVFQIEAVSSVLAAQAFLAEGRSVTIKPLNITQEVNTMDTTTVKTTSPKEGTTMIKEYLVHTTSLASSSAVDPTQVLSRIITNDESFAFDSKTVIIEQVDTGGYHWALLEHLFIGKSFAVNVTAFINPLTGERQLAASHGINKPEDVIFGWADFDAEYMIRVKGHSSSEFSDMSEFGLVVGNSAKMTKRLVELIRAARGFMVNKAEDKRLRILVMSHSDILDTFPHLETEDNACKAFDGISLMTVESAKRVYRNNGHMSNKAKSQTLNAMDNGTVTNHTIRVVTNVNGVAGMIKGNVLTAPRDQMLGRLRERGLISSEQVVDIVTSIDNFKEELGTDGTWEIITLEPHHGPGMVKTNDQTLAQFYGIPGLFEADHIVENFKQVLHKSYEDMVAGKDIEWMKNIRAERTSTELEKVKAINSSKVTNGMNKMIADIEELGLGLGVSQTLMFMRAQGILKMFLSDNQESGSNWKANAKEKKSFMFMPHAYRAYVMTKEVIWLAGYDIDLDGKQSFYHEATQTFCMMGITWAKVQGKLGGADLDDEIMIHERRYVRPNGTVNPLVAFLVRTPNDWAEFAILDLAESGPAFLTDGDIPTLNAKDLMKFKSESQVGNLPSKTNGSTRPSPSVWNWESTQYNAIAGLRKNGGVGGQVKTKMLQYGINNAPFSTLPCANEDMIDALQQCKGTVEDLDTLSAWSSQAMTEVLQSQPMDAYWWNSRNMFANATALKKAQVLTWWNNPLPASKSSIVKDLMIPREEAVRETHQEMIAFLNRNIMEIPGLEGIFTSKKQEMHYRKLVATLSKSFAVPTTHDEFGQTVRATKAQVSSHMQHVAVNLLERMASYQFRAGIEGTNLHVLRMVRASYLVKVDRPGANYDRWLYTAANDTDNIMTSYFVRALTWYRNQA